VLPAWQDLLQGANSQVLLFAGCVDILFDELVVLTSSSSCDCKALGRQPHGASASACWVLSCFPD